VNRGLLGLLVGLVGAVGAMWAARRFFGTPEEDLLTDGGAPAGSMAATASIAEAPRREGLDPTLLEILACPDDKAPVIYQKEGDAERLTCTKCGKRYPVRDGIPVMLIDEATPGPAPSEAEVTAARALIAEGKPAVVGAATAPPAAIPATPPPPAAPAAPAPPPAAYPPPATPPPPPAPPAAPAG
jgi:uncharacterized protein YbaR (Trm112 family)